MSQLMDWNPRGRIALIGTLDTKGDEILFVKQRLCALGAEVLVIDVGVFGAPPFQPESERRGGDRSGKPGHQRNPSRHKSTSGAERPCWRKCATANQRRHCGPCE